MSLPADPLAVPQPDLPDGAALRLLREAYGVTGSLSPLEGERDANWRVAAVDGRRLLLKVANPSDGEPVMQMQTAALEHIRARDGDLPVMRTLPTTAGDWWTWTTDAQGRRCAARLFGYLPGGSLPAAMLTGPALAGVGRATARLDRALRGFFHPAAGYELLWGLQHASRLRPLLAHVTDPALRGRAEAALDRFEARVAPALPGLRAQVIHGDLSLGNVLLDEKQQLSGVIDFGDMSHAPLVCELAVAVADVVCARADPLQAAGHIIKGYTSLVPLETDEAVLLADLVATRLAAGVCINAWRAHLHHRAESGEDHPEGSTGGAADAMLTAIQAAGPDRVARNFAEAAGGLPYRARPTGELLARRRRVLPRSPLFYDRPVHLVRGDGVWLFDPDGRRYLDCYNNVAVAGHAHPALTRAVAEQQRLLATHSRYLHEAPVQLAERLVDSMPAGLDSVLLVNSGSEAADLCWRLAKAATGRTGAIVTRRAYHGVTDAAHALSPEEWARGEQPGHVARVGAPDGYRGEHRRGSAGWQQACAAEIDPAVASLGERGLAAMYVDPAFTADGIHWPADEYLTAAAERVRLAGGLFVADEVQAGHGRSGRQLWSFASSGVTPDAVLMGKPMGGGFPVAAIVTRSELLEAIPEETEVFSTFAGNPVACAAALAVLDIVDDEGLVGRASDTGGHLHAGLLELAGRHRLIGDVRGQGLLYGIELVSDRERRSPAASAARAAVNALRERGVLIGSTGPDGNVLKVRPPLVFDRGHADLLLTALDEVLSELG